MSTFLNPVEGTFKLSKQNCFLSAAHCFQYKGNEEMLPPEFVIAWMGKHDLNVDNERGSQKRSVREIVNHPDWNFNSMKFDADISILVLDDAVEFTNRIQPICVPENAYENVDGEGTVVGWGK